MHYKQRPTAVSAGSQSCQINTPVQLSEEGDFLFSACTLIVFHKSLLRISFLLLNLKPASCIPLYISSWNQVHINHHFTNLSFLNTAIHTWPDDSSPEHLAAPTAASSSSWIIDTALESAQAPTWAQHRQFGQTEDHALVTTPLAQNVLDYLK